MTKPEKYWLFGMVMMLSVSSQEVPTLLHSIGNVLAYTTSVCFFIAMLWCYFRGEK